MMELLQKHFDSALDTPDGIKKLRGLILTLAMQGKLVPQNPNDEPASELLKKIEAEKKRLVKEGKIKKQNPLSPIKPDEIPYQIPTSWQWVRLGGIATHNSGKTLDKGRNEGILRNYITTSNLYWGHFILDELRQMPIREDELNKCSAKFGDLLICEGGEAGRAAVWNFSNTICIQNHIHRVRFFCNISPYLGYRFFEKLDYTGEIAEYRKGVGISNISGKTLSMILIPLPPLNEQKRIVARIDELMALCDRLEKLKEERDQKRLNVNASAIDSLLKAADKPSFDNAWQFITGNFNELYSVKENVAELRKAVLQLAVMGKLVPQNPNDEPASELLKKIEAEKKRLVKEGKIKKQNPLPPITPDEIPYQIPSSWQWVRLEEISTKIHYGYTASANIELKEIRLLRITDIQDNNVNWESVPGCDIKEKDVDQYLLSDNDILIARTGGTVGKSYLVKDIAVNAVFASYLIRVIPSKNTDARSLKYFLESPIYWKQLYEKCSGTGQPNVNGTSLSSLFLTLPPLNEQKRIVARIDELMALCDKLEKDISSAENKQTELFAALLSKIQEPAVCD